MKRRFFIEVSQFLNVNQTICRVYIIKFYKIKEDILILQKQSVNFRFMILLIKINFILFYIIRDFYI